jgi:hypothetical protein
MSARGTEASKDDHNLQRNLWPGLALAGGVLVAALITLLLLSAGGGRPAAGPLPAPTVPGVTRIFPPGGSAAATQYGAGGNRGTVLPGP